MELDFGDVLAGKQGIGASSTRGIINAGNDF